MTSVPMFWNRCFGWAVPFAWLFVFAALIWWLKFGMFSDESELRVQVIGLFGICAVMTLPYLLLVRQRRNPFSWRPTAFWLIVACVCTPSFLETDQFRYIWDGLVAASGLNPFRYAPDEIAWREQHFWAMHINHPHLPTIYPPFAQAMFQLSAYANPFFWRQELGWGFGLAGGAVTFFEAEFGFKLVVGLLMFFLLWALRQTRWDLIVFHPVFLLHVVSNSHVDALMMPGLALFLAFPGLRRPATTLSAWMTAVLAKWLPVVFAPLLFIRIYLKQGLFALVASSLFCLSLTVGAVSFYLKGSEGRLFESTWVYSQNWFFFGFAHRFLADALSVAGLSADPIGLARILGATASCLLLLVLIGLYLRALVSFQLALVFSLIVVLLFFPTLHPWYLIALLVLGVRHLRVLPVLWVWPLLGLGSHAFYLDMKDPFIVRITVYTTISLLLLHALVRIRIQRVRGSGFLACSPLRGSLWRLS